MRVDLAGKGALVTGSARGIGRAIADRLAGNGATVIYSDRDLADLEADKDRLVVPIDVSQRDSILSGVAEAVRLAGRIDILVNNAGIGVTAEQRKPVDEFPVEAWDNLVA